jgi:hypothetical protein
MKTHIITGAAIAAVTLAFSSCEKKTAATTESAHTPAAPGPEETVTAEEARAIAKEAYTYGFPLVDNYRVSYAYYTDKEDSNFKAPWNGIKNIPNVYTPADTAVQTPNSDTPYSWAGLDLRAEPVVITVPEIDKGRYYSIQFTDAYTFNYDYAGTRTTGNDAASFLVVGPGWEGETPANIKKVMRCETEFSMAIFRTQLFNPADIENVIMIQNQYQVQPLSEFLGTPAPAAAPAMDWVKPLTAEEQKTSLEFFNIMNFVLGYCPTHPTEVELRERFARIGIEGGKTFDPSKLSPEMKNAIEQGRADALEVFGGAVKELMAGKLTSGQCFGTREFLKNNYLNRWVGTVGIYGNSEQEAIYPAYQVDSNGERLSGANNYTLHFAEGNLPPVNAFWSLTMYSAPQSLLVANPINRYLINSPMLPDMKKDADGGLTLYIQNKSPGAELESNWLPAPEGPFGMYMRLYWPKEAALDGTWKGPKLMKVK